MPAHTDIALAKRAIKGDEDAWETIYRDHKPRLMSLCKRMVGHSDAEDLVQDTFLQIHRKLSQYQGKSRLGTWIFRCGINACLMHLRRKRPEHISLDALDSWQEMGGHDGVLDKTELRVRLQRALDCLTAEERNALLMHEVEGYQHAELVELLGLTRSTIQHQVKSAKNAMKSKLHGASK